MRTLDDGPTTPARHEPATTWQVVCLWRETTPDGRLVDFCHQAYAASLVAAQALYRQHRVQHASDASAVVDLLEREPGRQARSMILDARHSGPEAKVVSLDAVRQLKLKRLGGEA